MQLSRFLQELEGQKEPGLDSSLSKFLPLALPEFGAVRNLYKFSHYSDEPKYYKFKAAVGSISKIYDGTDYVMSASGYSFSSEREALLKCLGEAAERFCLKAYKKKGLFWSSYERLSKTALNPALVTSFSDKQKRKREFKIFNYSSSSMFNWVKGYSLTSQKPVWVPVQLVYVSYKRETREKMIRFPLSSGAAGGGCLSAAICRGIYELVERDGFVIHYLNKLNSPRVDLDSLENFEVNKILGIMKQYRLEIYTFDLTTDLKIPSFLSVVVDRTGLGPSVSVGLKAHIDPFVAIIGSMQESLNTREWMRKEFENDPSHIERINPKSISTLRDRGIFWFPQDRIEKLDFWLKQKPCHNEYRGVKQAAGKQLIKLLRVFKKKGYDVIFTDITVPKIKKLGYRVVTVLIPQLQPLSLKEKYPYLGGRRLYDVPGILGLKDEKVYESTFHRFPHPFL